MRFFPTRMSKSKKVFLYLVSIFLIEWFRGNSEMANLRIISRILFQMVNKLSNFQNLHFFFIKKLPHRNLQGIFYVKVTFNAS